MPSKRQKHAALRVDRLAPSNADLHLSDATTGAYRTFVGTAKTGISDSARRKIAAARDLADRTRKEPKGSKR